MANSSTLLRAHKLSLDKITTPIYFFKVVIDTPSQDLTIVTPGSTIEDINGTSHTVGTSDSFLSVLYADCSVNSGESNLTVKSGTIATHSLYYTNGIGLSKELSTHSMWPTYKAGDALIMQCDKPIPSLILGITTKVSM